MDSFQSKEGKYLFSTPLERPPLPDGRSIRLVELLPGKEGDDIVCNFSVVSLDDMPSYEVLSYTWGDKEMTKSIRISGRLLRITNNLESALQCVRHLSKIRVIWADLICIDQLNIAEKTCQVNLMGEIYEAADQCLIWMGDFRDYKFTASDAKDAFQIIKLFASDKHLYELPCFDGAKISDSYRRGFEAWEIVVLHPWWERVWTVQEVVLPRESTLCFGSQSISFGILLYAAECIIKHKTNDCCHGFKESLPRHLNINLNHFTASLTGINLARKNRSSMLSLDLLWRFRFRRASDPRDKVFALLGLLQRDIKGDYTMNTAKVYEKFALDLLCSEGNLMSFIGHRGEPSQIPGLPSWATDWMRPPENGGALSRYWDHRFKYPWFSCDNGEERVMKIHEEISTIDLEGIFVDDIVQVGKPLMEDEKGEISDFDVRSRIKEWSKLTNIAMKETAEIKSNVIKNKIVDGVSTRSRNVIWNPDVESSLQQGDSLKSASILNLDTTLKYLTGETILEAFWRTLICNLVLDYTIAQPLPNNEEPLRKAIASDYDSFNAFCDSQKRSGSDAFDQSLKATLVNQAFFVTEKGYMGIGPCNMKIGDEIWVLFGSNVPFVLRNAGQSEDSIGTMDSRLSESNQGYVKIGDCYVHGIMEGQAVKGQESKRRIVSLR